MRTLVLLFLLSTTCLADSDHINSRKIEYYVNPSVEDDYDWACTEYLKKYNNFDKLTTVEMGLKIRKGENKEDRFTIVFRVLEADGNSSPLWIDDIDLNYKDTILLLDKFHRKQFQVHYKW